MDCSSMLWYTSKAETFDEALPIGNGRIGGMIFGGTDTEKIILNEDSVWSGTKRERNNDSAFKNLEKLRTALKNEEIKKAEKMILDYFAGTPTQQRHYQPLGNITIRQEIPSEVKDYKRLLNLKEAVAVTEWNAGETRYKREIFVSAKDQVMCIHFTSDQKKKVSFEAYIDGRDDNYDINSRYDDTTLVYGGCTGSKDGIHFNCALSAISLGGKVEIAGSKLRAKDCDEVLLVVSARTSFYSADFKNLSLNDAHKALRKGFADIKRDHIKDYSSLYQRAELMLEDNSDGACKMTTDKRLHRLSKERSQRQEKSKKDIYTPVKEEYSSFFKDNKLIELYWNFGRYLMISGSRKGTLPLNLQGIWNEDMNPAWGSKYTININTEMNYWCAEQVNLSECHDPLFDLIERMRENGRYTAQYMYGCRGFTAHHNTDLWGDTAPQDTWLGATLWPMGAAWLCLHLWEHYQYTKDETFLSDKYDTMKEAAEFFVDFLIEDEDGLLTTSPSVSPENTYITEHGIAGSVCMGAAMDIQIIRELFYSVIEGGKILGKDEKFLSELQVLCDRLPEIKIGQHGQIMEWSKDYQEKEPGHRHISQLFGLYPASQITKRYTKELADAAEKTLERRLMYGGGHTGWSRAWIINMWARLLNGEQVYEHLMRLLSWSTNDNLLDNHPPFQIDGNFGGAAGITESILQSHSGELHFLPALPEAWKNGQVRGLLARGGFEVSVCWSDHMLMSAEIVSKAGITCRIYSEIPLSINVHKVEVCDSVYSFETERGKVYKIIPAYN